MAHPNEGLRKVSERTLRLTGDRLEHVLTKSGGYRHPVHWLTRAVALKEDLVEKAVPWKYLLTRIGSLLPPKAIYVMNASLNYLEVGRWMHAHGYNVAHRVDHRTKLFDLVGRQIADRVVLYLEFGVFQGAATRYWSGLLRNPESKLHGFDSFEGLPETWVRPDGHFSVGGQIPKIADPRVEFFKGWFSDTLPGYQFPSHEQLVVILDADLYSSTSFVLTALEQIIVPGTYLYFDEFNHRNDELRAFDEFVRRTGMEFSLIGATRSLAHVMFQRR